MGSRGLGTKDAEKAEIVLSLPLFFLVRFSFRNVSLGNSKSVWRKGYLPSVKENQIRKLNRYTD